MPLPGESPMQGTPAGQGQIATPPGMQPSPAQADPYAAMIGTLQRQIRQSEEKMQRDANALSASEKESWEARKRELDPIRDKINQAIDKRSKDVGAPDLPTLPSWQGGPIVNEQDYTKFGFIALAIGMIGGIASKGDWLA